MILDKNTPSNMKAMLGKTGDTTFQIPNIDEITHHLVSITEAHHEIHEGDSFTASFKNTTANSDGDRTGIYFKTPASGPKIHAVFSCGASAAADCAILEAPTIAANTGSHGVAIYNRDRDSTNASVVFDNATARAVNKVTTLDETEIAGDGTWATGTVLRDEAISTGQGPQAAGGSSRGTREYILKADTAYVLLITNTAANANNHLVEIDWYEHTSKEA